MPGKSRGQRRLAGYSPWGRKEADTTEVTEHTLVSKMSVFEKHIVSFSCRSFLPEVHFLEQRAKVFLLVLSFVLHRDSKIYDGFISQT